ncbi:hypothetical protein [Mucisphaera calidilacus]|uniref:Uncharacterized protein n=1 Tax=Mucisphaera calidilacus TaxID=2527982 RepID=A0A518BXN0_9BACT|nr:hypothetical protein [Mucisphaera calidilacus]QDU71731.1 hypothetical protein Pan265_15840 [Mucisphaera calidilacus]
MNIEKFLGHHGVSTNPFAAEEASLDPVFDRMLDGPAMHPDFAKVLGRIDRPSGAVVFGEKGSGKTAMRLMTERHVARHNEENPESRILIVPYDDLNPVLDRMTRWFRGDELVMLDHFGLADHQDAILSRAVTRLIDGLLDDDPETVTTPLPQDAWQRLRRLRRDQRIDFLALAAFYDQPVNGSMMARWQRLKQKLRTGWRLPHQVILQGAILLSLLGAGLAATLGLELGVAFYLTPAAGITLGGAIALWVWWCWSRWTLWSRCKQLIRELRPIDRTVEEMMSMLGQIGAVDLARQPLPVSGKQADESKPADDGRYRLTQRLIEVLGVLGYTGVMVIMDRVDEPTIISGNPTRMRPLIWPLFDNKFFQQPGVGIKLLLPIELRHLLYKESPEFFQSARLDKQSLIDRLSWSGATLYDLCSSRLRACRQSSNTEFYLTDLFAEDVTTPLLVDALDQMHQPRDAFKFVYNVIQEHCRIIPEDEENYQIARLTLDNVRQRQAQRVQDLYRGLSPG